MDKKVTYLNNESLVKWYETYKTCPELMIIDIREPHEYAKECIPGSTNMPLSTIATIDPLVLQNKMALIHCQAGLRTMRAMPSLLSLPFSEIFCLPGGINQWKQCHLPVQKRSWFSLSVERQAQVVLGGFLLLNVVLMKVVSFSFIYLFVFLGLGLIMTGWRNFSLLEKCLMRAPWNRLNQN